MSEISVYVMPPYGEEGGQQREVKIPLGISMSLMEALKAYDEPIEATCGGMALCASCHIQVLDGIDSTGGLTDDEEAMLDTLPEYSEQCRLSCQIMVNEDIDGIRIRYMQPVLA